MAMSAKGILLAILSGIIFSLFVFSTTTLILVNALDATVLSKEYYYYFLEEHDVYEKIYGQATAMLSSIQPQISEIIKEKFSLQDLKRLLNSTIGEFIDYLKIEEKTIPSIALPTLGVLPEETRFSLEAIVGREPLEQAKQIVQSMLALKTILLASSIVLLLLLVLISKKVSGKIKRLGQALLAAGLSGVIMYASLEFIVPQMPSPFPAQAGVQAELVKQAYQIILDMFKDIGLAVLVQSAPLVIIGALAWIAGFLLARKEKQSQATA